MPRYAYRIEQGFTLIELVVVIVIVGIVSAAALPRFSNLSASAIQAANAQFVGTFKKVCVITWRVPLLVAFVLFSTLTTVRTQLVVLLTTIPTVK